MHQGTQFTCFTRAKVQNTDALKALQVALCVYALAMLALSLARSDGEVYCALVLASMGATALPSSLSFLANQAKHDSQGAMQVMP